MSSIDAYFVHADTKVRLVKLGASYCIAFDFRKRSMTGIAIEDHSVATALSKHFAAMAKALKEKEKKNEQIKKGKKAAGT